MGIYNGENFAASPSNYSILCYIENLVNVGFYTYGDRIRCVPINIGGTSYIFPISNEYYVKNNIENILNKSTKPIKN